MKRFKYLITNGCSLTWGEGCNYDETYSFKIAKKLNLELINLSIPGTGWYNLENSTTSFIHNNQSIIKDCFFILQKSTIDRGLDYNHISLYPTSVRKKYNMDFVSMYDFSHLGLNESENRKVLKYEREDLNFPCIKFNSYSHTDQNEFLKSEKWAKLKYFPRHRHYHNNEFKWKLGENYNTYPEYIEEQFQELMLHWTRKVLSFHLFLKSLNVSHIFVDGYFPLFSHKLNFRNYYDSQTEFEMVNKFWSNEKYDDGEMVYDFKNIKSSYLLDKIDVKFKIDDLVLWSLFTFKDVDNFWSFDGVHPGIGGMNNITEVILKNLFEKKWF